MPSWYYRRLNSDSESQIGDFVALFHTGDVVIANLAFGPTDAIDMEAGPAHVVREKDSPYLRISVNGEDYLFQYRPQTFVAGYWLSWTQAGMPDRRPHAMGYPPRITWKNDLFWEDLWKETGGGIVALVVVAVLLSFIHALVFGNT